ncbi:ROK family transcriptional regulator [Lysinibacter sp. HNR]|uniref:ROK family transcriptional regulator n=1 Tax=Lysinibacter sp. HNR TaxID=3031408 RepID=UPI002434C698|nr:ROK family transcriptional regulator [Lysinibacter sp. HNR]WGD38182.1 ROK family transcriptional regulator [Lysinibacter sp. HNR]
MSDSDSNDVTHRKTGGRSVLERALSSQSRSLTANDHRVLNALINNGPMDRPALAADVGISRPAMLDLVKRLVSEGLIRSVGESETVRPGPNSVLYAVRHDLAITAGIELHPSSAEALIAYFDGTVIGQASIRDEGYKEPVELIRRVLELALVDTQRSIADLSSVVIATPGVVSPHGDMSFVWGQPAWKEGQLERIETALGVPIRLENDLNLAAVAEHRLGVAQQIVNFAVINCGEGMGASLMLGSELVRGLNGAAGEIGYLPSMVSPFTAAEIPHDSKTVSPDKAAGCPQNSSYSEDFQSFAGISTLTMLLHEMGVPHADPVEFLATEQNSPVYEKFAQEVARRIAVGITAVCAVVDPGFIVLTGVIARAGGDSLLRLLRSHMAKNLPFPPEIVLSELRERAVVNGALITALDTVRAEIFGVDQKSPLQKRRSYHLGA